MTFTRSLFSYTFAPTVPRKIKRVKAADLVRCEQKMIHNGAVFFCVRQDNCKKHDKINSRRVREIRRNARNKEAGVLLALFN